MSTETTAPQAREPQSPPSTDYSRLSSKAVGVLGEDIAARYLSDYGYRIHHRNYRTRYGEIDIVATKRDALVIVEVKTRRTWKYGRGLFAVDENKLRRIRRMVGQYLTEHAPSHGSVQIDAIDIHLSDGNLPRITHLKAVGA